MAGSRWCVCAAAALSLAIVAPPSSADVAPGDRVTGENVAKAKELISPGLEWCIEHGFPITVTDTKRVEWPRAYREATEKYAAQVKLSPHGLRVLDFSSTIAGPSAVRHLADFGAQVIKVESKVHPDGSRHSTPFAGGVKGINRSGYYAAYNAGKLSLALNMQLEKKRV